MTTLLTKENLARAAFFTLMALTPFVASRVWASASSACGMSGCGCGDSCACGDACNCDHAAR